MKVPLRFQVTEYDCGTTSLINAISYLYDREDTPVLLIRAIEKYTLDEYIDENNDGGTSQKAIKFLCNWITDYANEKNMGLKCERLTKENVTLERIKECTDNNGVVLARLLQGYDHYVIITDVGSEYVYLFDPYYFNKTYYDSDKQVEIIFNEPFKYNRKVTINRFVNESEQDFSLGKIEYRECVLMNKG